MYIVNSAFHEIYYYLFSETYVLYRANKTWSLVDILQFHFRHNAVRNTEQGEVQGGQGCNNKFTWLFTFIACNLYGVTVPLLFEIHVFTHNPTVVKLVYTVFNCSLSCTHIQLDYIKCNKTDPIRFSVLSCTLQFTCGSWSCAQEFHVVFRNLAPPILVFQNNPRNE